MVKNQKDQPSTTPPGSWEHLLQLSQTGEHDYQDTEFVSHKLSRTADLTKCKKEHQETLADAIRKTQLSSVPKLLHRSELIRIFALIIIVHTKLRLNWACRDKATAVPWKRPSCAKENRNMHNFIRCTYTSASVHACILTTIDWHMIQQINRGVTPERVWKKHIRNFTTFLYQDENIWKC